MGLGVAAGMPLAAAEAMFVANVDEFTYDMARIEQTGAKRSASIGMRVGHDRSATGLKSEAYRSFELTHEKAARPDDKSSRFRPPGRKLHRPGRASDPR
jgi:hypothetical protein